MSSLRMDVRIEAPIDLVWSAWTEPERITVWFAPEANIEARSGGPFELFFDPDDHSHECTKGCVFTLVEPKCMLGFNWKGPSMFADLMNDIEPLTSVEVTFHDEGEATRVIVEHSGWGEGKDWAEAREWHRRAWEGVLTSLKSALESGDDRLIFPPNVDT
ncbi:MAG: SRPBCC domain-containing protein [Candidatus Bathyarchaeota archaeon]|nr:MAG: SRPBCC domain-containing protein [Candidatus Bathyarchaeota archaeon]